MQPPSPSAPPVPSVVEFNDRALDAATVQQLRALEALIGIVLPGRYWYDAMSGGAGAIGGPAAAYLGPGLALGGSLAPGASGGGDGRTTGVFVNGRELHPLDVAGLRRWGPLYAGRYWWDRFGNVGLEGGPMLFNFHALTQRPGRVAAHGRLQAGDEGSASYYAVG